MNLDPRNLDRIDDQLKTILETVQTTQRAMGTVTPRVNKDLAAINDKIIDMNKGVSDYRDQLGDLQKAERILRKRVSERSDVLDGLGKKEKKRIQGLMALGRKQIREQKRDIEGYIKLQEESIADQLKAQKKIERATSKSIKKSSEETKKSTGGKRTLSAFGGYTYTREFKERKYEEGAATPEIVEELTGGIKDLTQPFDSLLRQFKILNTNLMPTSRAFSTGPKLKRRSGELGEWADVIGSRRREKKISKLKASGASPEKIEKVGKSLGVLGGSIKALSGALSLLSKLNWLFAIAQAIAAVVKAGFELQKFLADLNKTFLKMAGPTAGIRDIASAMKEFRQSIFDMGRNIKLGINSKDIQEMFGAISAAGMSLQGVQKYVGSYNKMITEARVLSLELGTSMSTMGTMISDQMLNVRNSLEDTSKSFRRMAFDAAKAGISTEKFWQSIQSATSTLSYFGDFIKSTSALLVSFREGAQLGYRDAEKVTKGLVDAFSGIDWKKGMKILPMMGEQAMTMFKEVRDNLNKGIIEKMSKMEELKVKLDVASDKGERSLLNKQISTLALQIEKENQRFNQLSSAINKAEGGDFSMLATQIGYLAERPVTAIMTLMEKFGDYFPAQAEALGKLIGLSEEQVLRLRENIAANVQGFKSFVDTNTGNLKEIVGQDKDVANVLKSIIKERARGGSAEQLMSTMERTLLDVMGWDQGRATDFLTSFDSMIRKGLNEPLEEMIDRLVKGETIADFQDKKTVKRIVARAMETGSDTGSAELRTQTDRIEELVSKTMSGGDYMAIMKESLKSQLAEGLEGQLSILNTMTAKGVQYLSDLVGHFTGQSHNKFQKDIEKILPAAGKSEIEAQKRKMAVLDIASEAGQKLSDKDLLEVMRGERAIPGLSKKKTKEVEKLRSEWDEFMKSVATGKAFIIRAQELGLSSKAIELYESGKKGDLKEKATPLGKDLTMELYAAKAGTTLSKATAEASIKNVETFMKPFQMGSALLGTSAPSDVTYNINMGGITLQGDVTDPDTLRRTAKVIADTTQQEIKKANMKEKVPGG